MRLVVRRITFSDTPPCAAQGVRRCDASSTHHRPRLHHPELAHLSGALDGTLPRVPDQNHPQEALRRLEPAEAFLRNAWSGVTTRLHVLARREFVQLLIGAGAAYGVLAFVHTQTRRLFQDSDFVIGGIAFVITYFVSQRIIVRVLHTRLLPRIAAWWLRMRANGPLLVDGIATGLAAVGLIGISKAFHVQVSGLGGEVPLAIAILLVSYLLVSQVTNLMVGTLVRNLYLIAASAQGPVRGTLLAFVNRHLGRLDIQIKAILSQEGAELDIAEVRFWTEQSFAFGEGRYDGTDSHLPSQFVAIYPNYLRAHGQMLSRHGTAPPNTRILIGAHDRFRDDYIDHYETGYGRFLDWHEEFNVQLWHMDRAQADRAIGIVAERIGGEPLPTVDVAVWYDQYALLFCESEEPQTVHLWMVFPGDNWYDQCTELIHVIKDGLASGDETPEAMALPLKAAVPEIFHKPLCLAWESFMNPDIRMEKLGPFFDSILRPNRGGAILDAAAGIGTDGLWLAEHGYDISLNEIEPVYRRIIGEKVGRRRVPVYTHDWRHFPAQFGHFFDTMLVLGNSLCLVTSVEQQKRVMDAFYDVLRPGGRIVIDERNFAHFMDPDDVQTILRNPVRHFPYHNRVMYCGDQIRACPKTIAEDGVTFRYYASDYSFDHQLRSVEVLTPQLLEELDRREVGALRMYPFRKGQLAQILMDAGFHKVRVYADLESSSPKAVATDPNWYSADADFLTYVAEKPHAPLADDKKEQVCEPLNEEEPGAHS